MSIMPELPDVERFKKHLDATALHEKLRKVEVRDADVLQHVSAHKLRRHLQGQEFESTTRHGKFLFVHVPSPPLLVLHFGMTGYLDYARQDREPPKHTRILFHFANEYWLAYVSQRKLGRVTLTGDAEDFVRQQEMGPDALDDQLTFAQFRQRLKGRRGKSSRR
jgi:formamidopyrimidine-DNA glycosylase